MRGLFVAAMLMAAPLAAAADQDVKAALALLAEPGDGAPDLDEAVLQEWPEGGDGLWIAAAYFDDDEPRLKAGVLRETVQGLRLVARSEAVEPQTMEPAHKLWLSVDKTTFRISPTEYAVALRVGNSFNSTSRASSSSALHLFRLRGGKLTQIFAEVLSYGALEKPQFDDEGNEKPRAPEDGEAEDVDDRSVVLFARTRTKGFYNLLVRNLKTKKTTTYRWNGSAYEP